jgi:hypothetical protein
MADNPDGHSYDDAASVLVGLDFRPPRKPQGSHRFWKHTPSGCRIGLVDTGKRSMPPEYIKTMVQQLQDYKLFPATQKRGHP